jgi:hypothetical protein
MQYLQAYLPNNPMTVNCCSKLSCSSDSSLSRVSLQSGHCNKLHVHFNNFMQLVCLGMMTLMMTMMILIIIVIIVNGNKAVPCRPYILHKRL